MMSTEHRQQGPQVAKTTARKEERPCLVTPYFLLRVTGMPFTVLDQLQCPRTAALIEEILEIEAWQERRRDPLLTALASYTAYLADKNVQHKGLDLRRAIANDNGKKASKQLQTLRTQLPEALFTEAEDWCQRSIRRAELLALGEPTLQAELLQCRTVLRQILRDESFQQGLLLSSPTLYTELQYYLNAPPDKQNNRLRRIEEGLLSYLVRMATKTSPYSTFTSTSLGVWLDEIEQPICMNIEDWQQKSFVRFHTGVLDTIVEILATRPEIRPYLRPALNTSLTRLTDAITQAEKVEFLVQEKLPDRPLSTRYHERLSRIQLNPLLKRVINLIAAHEGRLTYAEIVERVAGAEFAQGGEKSSAKYSRSMVSEALEYLAQRSIIAIDLRIPEHEDDKIGFLINRLSGISDAWVGMICRMFQDIKCLADTYHTKMAGERLSVLQDLKQRLLEVSSAVGPLREPQNPPWNAAERIEKAFPGLLLEDTTLSFTELALRRNAWQPVLDDLAVLQGITPLVSEDIIGRMMIGSLAKEAGEAFSTQVSDILHYHQYVNKNYKPMPKPARPWREICPQSVAWIEARQALTSLIARHIQQALVNGDKTLAIDPVEIAQITETLPASLLQPFALNHFGHLFIEQGEPQMVLNLAWQGPGTAFSRFSYMLGERDRSTGKATPGSFTRTLQNYIAQLGERHGGIYASLTETAGFNVNVHNCLTPYEILLPHSVSQYPIDRQLHLRDLRVIQIPETAEVQLWSQKLQKRVFPIHMGFSIPTVLSPLYQTLILSSLRQPTFSMIELFEDQMPKERKRQNRHYPRITLGHLVIHRESWKFPFLNVPQREAKTAFEYFLTVNRWRTHSGLPLEGFRSISSRAEHYIAKQSSLLATLREDASSQPQRDNTKIETDVDTARRDTETGKKAGTNRIATPSSLRKPFYTHFHSYFLVALLGTALKAMPADETLTFEEMLPTRTQHVLTRGTQSYATEFVIEVSR